MHALQVANGVVQLVVGTYVAGVTVIDVCPPVDELLLTRAGSSSASSMPSMLLQLSAALQPSSKTSRNESWRYDFAIVRISLPD